MNKQLYQRINRALSHIKADEKGAETLRRYNREMEWFDADPGRAACLKLLADLCARVRHNGAVLSPGYGFPTNSFVMKLAGIHAVNPVEWNLPFDRFIQSFQPGCTIPIETGTGGLDAAREVLQGRDGEFIIENEPGVFDVTFLDGEEFNLARIQIITYTELDRFPRTVKEGWHALDEATLRHFGRGTTDDSVWFETDKMREWLTEFGPESMSDLVLLRALYYPKRIALYPEILRRKLNPNSIPSAGDARADRILRDTFGVLVYQSQARQLKDIGRAVPDLDYDLALKGHEVARTMMSVEALWPERLKTSLK